MMSIWLGLLGALGFAVLFGFGLARLRPAWSPARVALVAATPLPMVGGGLCLYIFQSAANTPQDKCGVDACGMAMVAAIYCLTFCVGVFLIGFLCSLIAQRLADRR
jgi:hypothetical protein